MFGVVFGSTIAIRTAYESWRMRRLIQQLASSTADSRDAALDALSDMHVDLTDNLIELMTHDNPDVREFAAFSLYRQVPIPYEVVPAFATALLNERETDLTRRWVGDTFTNIAIQAQGTLTAPQRQVVATLRQALRSNNKFVAASAARGIAEFGPKAVSAELDLLELWTANPTIEVGGALCLVHPGKYEATVLPVLIAELDTSDDDKMMLSLYWLGRLGVAAADAVPKLHELSKTQPDWTYPITETIEQIQADR